MVSNDLVIVSNELEMMSEEALVSYLKVLPRIFLESLRNTTNELS